MMLRGDVFSQTLEMETGITILTPPTGMGKPPYRVVYLLHGLSGRSGDWLDYTMLPVFAREYEVVFIMPEVGRSFYTDMRYGQQFFSYVVDELPLLSRTYFNISARREDTAVIGNSMGGYGALKCALTKPDSFGMCCALASACLFLKERTGGLTELGDIEKVRAAIGEQLVRDFQGAFGEGMEIGPEADIMTLARAAATGKNKPRIYSACGADDDLVDDNRKFRDEMLALGFDFTYEEWAGSHDWRFFNTALELALRFCFGK